MRSGGRNGFTSSSYTRFLSRRRRLAGLHSILHSKTGSLGPLSTSAVMRSIPSPYNNRTHTCNVYSSNTPLPEVLHWSSCALYSNCSLLSSLLLQFMPPARLERRPTLLGILCQSRYKIARMSCTHGRRHASRTHRLIWHRLAS
jgi:hypothetical protein